MEQLATKTNVSYGDFNLHIDHVFPLEGITVLFGPSGCGKTTLLRIIAGFEDTASGHIRFGSEVWQSSAERIFVPPHQRGAGYVFQDTRLFPHLSVQGNLCFADKRSKGRDSRISYADVVSAFDLEPLLTRRSASLSGGEKQRVAIARALLTRPRLLLMDEPLSGLDYRRKAGILPYIEQLPSAFGVPVIYVTHAIDEVTRLADRMVVLADGVKLADGDVTEVLERHDIQKVVGRFEAGVVLNAIVHSHDEPFKLTRFDCNGARITMPHAGLPIGAPVRLRVRARDVAIALEKPQGTSIRNILPGTIAEIAEEADTAFAETLIDIGGARLRARITRKSVAVLDLKVGKPVYALLKTVSFDRRALPRLTHKPSVI